MSKRTGVLAVLGFCWLLAACGQAAQPESGTIVDPGLMARAVAEATAIAQQVQATAMILQDRALATALAEERPTAAATVALSPAPAAAATGSPTSSPPRAPIAVEVLGVGLAADGGLIAVRFVAPPAEAASWAADSVAVVDEGSGTVHDRVPAVPDLGPLIGRPSREGQMGYVLLENGPPGLHPGAVVTVVLGAYRFEHMVVQ
jgi:hypothetical protein